MVMSSNPSGFFSILFLQKSSYKLNTFNWQNTAAIIWIQDIWKSNQSNNELLNAEIELVLSNMI